MSRLIHLNGPSGAGKSTLARRFVDEHPGTLNLEADRVATMIGGWERDFAATLTPARRLATAMAETHLASGRDVIMPQLATSLDQVACFEEAAIRTGSTYLEIALLVEPEEQVVRFRGRPPATEPERHIGEYIEGRGGATVLNRIHRHFAEYLQSRPNAKHLDTRQRSVDATYRALLTEVL